MRLPVTVLLALVLALAGCGSDEDRGAEGDYVAAVNTAQKAFATRFDRVSEDLPATTTPAQDARALDGFRQACEQTATDLRRIEPPEEVRAAHGRLVAAVADYARELTRLRTELREGGPGAQAAVRTALSSGGERLGQRFATAVDEVNRRLQG